nr:antitermination protein [Providencia rettgeri]
MLIKTWRSSIFPLQICLIPKRVPSSAAFSVIRHLVPDLNERTWRRNWKPFYEKLTSKYFIEEGVAEYAFSKVTK